MSAQTFVPLEFPAWATWAQRKGIQLNHPENDWSRCRWCGSALTGRRTSWCSDECSERFGRVWSWGAVRNYVIQRDGERCTRCDTDRPGRWEVDHTVRVVDGGTDHPENLRLLCTKCHIAVGYEQRAAAKCSPVRTPVCLAVGATEQPRVDDSDVDPLVYGGDPTP